MSNDNDGFDDVELYTSVGSLPAPTLYRPDKPMTATEVVESRTWGNCPCGGGYESCPCPVTGKLLCDDSITTPVHHMALCGCPARDWVEDCYYPLRVDFDELHAALDLLLPVGHIDLSYPTEKQML